MSRTGILVAAISVLLLVVAFALVARADCSQKGAIPPCYVSGPAVLLCTEPARAWDGGYEWLIGTEVAATTEKPEVVLPCHGLTELRVRVRAKGGPISGYSKPIHCMGVGGDTNQDKALSSLDTARTSTMVARQCALNRRP